MSPLPLLAGTENPMDRNDREGHDVAPIWFLYSFWMYVLTFLGGSSNQRMVMSPYYGQDLNDWDNVRDIR